MRIGLMIGSDKERSRADRLAGLLDDGKTAESDGFASFWIPQVPGYLDAMTAVALLGQVTERIEIGTAVVPIQTRHPLIMAQQALTTQVACSGRFTLGIGPSHHWIISDQLGLPYDKPAAAGARLSRRAGCSIRRSRPDCGGQRQLPGAQPGGRHRGLRHAGARGRTRTRDAADRRRTHRRNDPVDGRRAGHRRLRGPAHHGCGERRRTHRNPRRGRRACRALFERARPTAPVSTRAKCSVTPTSPPTTSDCSSTATPKTSETPWPQVTNRLSSHGCAATATPASPISLFAWFRSDRMRGAQRISTPHSGVRRLAGARIRFWSIGAHELDGDATHGAEEQVDAREDRVNMR